MVKELIATSQEHIKILGRILSNRNKVRMLHELAKTPLPQSKIAEIIGVSPGTVSQYVRECVTAGLIKEEPTLDNRGSYRKIVHLKHDSIFIMLRNVEREVEIL